MRGPQARLSAGPEVEDGSDSRAGVKAMGVAAMGPGAEHSLGARTSGEGRKAEKLGDSAAVQDAADYRWSGNRSIMPGPCSSGTVRFSGCGTLLRRVSRSNADEMRAG